MTPRHAASALVLWCALCPATAGASKHGKAQAASPHEGTCLRNDGAPVDAAGRTQFICFSGGELVHLRCDLGGEGGNVRVGTRARHGANAGIDFSPAENHGNGGFMVCPAE